MPSRNPVRFVRLTLMTTLLALSLGLGGCQSDDAASPDRASSRSRRPGATSDAGSRFLDASGPVGGLTVETPPVVVPEDEGPVGGRSVTQR